MYAYQITGKTAILQSGFSDEYKDLLRYLKRNRARQKIQSQGSVLSMGYLTYCVQRNSALVVNAEHQENQLGCHHGALGNLTIPSSDGLKNPASHMDKPVMFENKSTGMIYLQLFSFTHQTPANTSHMAHSHKCHLFYIAFHITPCVSGNLLTSQKGRQSSCFPFVPCQQASCVVFLFCCCQDCCSVDPI